MTRNNLLVSFLLGGGTIAVARHGNAARADKDRERQLSPKGREQASVMQDAMIKSFDVGMIMSSAAPRAIDTVSREEWPDAHRLEQLYIPEGSPVAAQIDLAFGLLGYASLAAYNLDPTTRLAIKQWAYEAMNEMSVRLVGAVPEMTGRTMLVGCHAVMSSALIVAIAQAVQGDADVKVAMSVVQGDAEVLTLQLVDGEPKIEYLNAAKLAEMAATA